MPFPGYPLSTTYTNATAQSTTHPAAHAALAAACNDLQSQLAAFSLEDIDLQNQITANLTVQTSSPLGVVGYASRGSDQSGITTITDLTDLTVTFTAVSGRTYKANSTVRVLSTVAGDIGRVVLTTGAGTELQSSVVSLIVATQGYTSYLHHVTASISGATTWKLRLERSSGTGSLTNSAASSRLSFLLVEDIGVL